MYRNLGVITGTVGVITTVVYLFFKGSREKPHAIDGLGYNINEVKPLDSRRSYEKLGQLIRANHFNYAVLCDSGKKHNDLSRTLTCAYFLGATSDQLTAIYERGTKRLTPWQEDYPEVVTILDWRKFLGDPAYERTYFDLFEETIADSAKYKWREVLSKFVTCPNGLIKGLTAQCYAFELDCPEIAAEALTLAAVDFFDMSSILSPIHVEQTSVSLDILKQVREDTLFDHLPSSRPDNIQQLIQLFPERISLYRSKLDVSDAKAALRDLLYTCVLLTCATSRSENALFDFPLFQTLLGTHAAIEILAGSHANWLSAKQSSELVRDVWTAVLLCYLINLRPQVHVKMLENVVVNSWESVLVSTQGNTALHGDHLQTIRALLVCDCFLNSDVALKAATILFAR